MTGDEVRIRLVEAFEIEGRLPANRGSGSAWPAIVREFSDHVGWPDASERVWRQWESLRGVTPQEYDRWAEATGWLIDLRDHRDEQRCLARWAMAKARRIPVTVMARREPWSRVHFYRLMMRGSELIAHRLNTSRLVVTG